ncbi:protealysin inhibitor emfourin [Paracoccus sp. (in: a-proteobacteria)]|uniref:protealysin inhibitor emfourin n=1 Tax=Paracoccus sp. TaxID=267 RepID=UPI00396C2E0E
MIIEIHGTGGFGAIPTSVTKRVDVKQQPHEVQAALLAAFQPQALSQLEGAPCPTCPDRMRYAITVTGADGCHSFTLSEGQMSDDMLDLIDSL